MVKVVAVIYDLGIVHIIRNDAEVIEFWYKRHDGWTVIGFYFLFFKGLDLFAKYIVSVANMRYFVVAISHS